MKRIFYLYIILSLGSCKLIFKEPPATIDDPRIIAEAKKRLDRYTARKKANCRERVIEEAIIHVDTIITQRFEALLNASESFPDRPDRPERPERLEIDSFFKPEPLNLNDSLTTLPPLDTSSIE